MKMKKIDPEKIFLNGLRIIKASFEMNTDQIDSLETTSIFKLGLRSEPAFDYKENIHRFRLFFKATGMNDDETKIICYADYGIEFHYYIENLEDYLTEDEEMPGGYSVNSVLGATIAGISYSTSRGIILERTQSTNFRGIILPVIDPFRLITEDTYTEEAIVE